jgi:Polyribonucleotide nucleotidyltransferase (polynucleotide phosphorylase)
MEIASEAWLFPIPHSQASKTISIPKEHHKNILGKAGTRLQELQKLTSTKISIPNINDQSEEISITGPREGIEKAMHEIQMISDEQSKKAFEKVRIHLMIKWISFRVNFLKQHKCFWEIRSKLMFYGYFKPYTLPRNVFLLLFLTERKVYVLTRPFCIWFRYYLFECLIAAITPDCLVQFWWNLVHTYVLWIKARRSLKFGVSVSILVSNFWSSQ